MAARLSYTGRVDTTALRFEALRFDLVWCEHVAMNIADRPKLYREFRRVLKPGGYSWRSMMSSAIDGRRGAASIPCLGARRRRRVSS